MRRRIAFIDYFCPHYRAASIEEIARRMEADFYFFADERERRWNSQIPIVEHGDFRTDRAPADPDRRTGDDARDAARLSRNRYDAVIKNLNGKLMFPSLYLTARARARAVRALDRHVVPPADARSTAPRRRLTEGVYRDVGAIVAYGDHVKRFLAEHARRRPGQDLRRRPGGRARPLRAPSGRRATARSRRSSSSASSRSYKGVSTTSFDAFDAPRPGAGAAADRRQRPAGGAGARRVAGARRRSRSSATSPQDELPAELARARCLVLPSVTTDLDREPWGLVINEAMHAGVPVVASDAVGAAAGGLVRDGRNGFVVPERDPRRSRRRCAGWWRTRELAERMGEQAARRRASVQLHAHGRRVRGTRSSTRSRPRAATSHVRHLRNPRLRRRLRRRARRRSSRMRDAIAHRGPDDAGVAGAGPRSGVGARPPPARRSSTSRRPGRQPMSNEDGTVWITYNGEVYNHDAAARRSSRRKGHRYRSHTDTETIVHLYEEEGPRCVERLEGMFALRDLGRPARASCSWPATGSASSRSTTPAAPAASSSARRSRRSSRTRRSRPTSTRTRSSTT